MSILTDYAMSFVGRPYIWGGDDAIKGYDCSGFVQELLASQGIEFDTDLTAHGIYLYMKHNGLEDEPGEGSLCFYGNRHRMTHVAMFLDCYFIIEAAGGGAKTKTRDDAIRDNAFIRIRPYNYRGDFKSIYTPGQFL